ncbi:MAG: sulfatase-like hydrolase/transferase [Verrucomicrobiales bacterium]
MARLSLFLVLLTLLHATAKPNVLIIYADDQGSLDLGCYGSEDLQTPHLDALAKRGVRFTQMYSPSAICSASRAGLLTGRIPARAGVPGNVSSYKGKPGMPASEITIAEMLGQSGYDTGHVGKWHLGYTPETMPNGQGFANSFGHMGGCIDNYSHFFYWNGPNRHDLWQNGQEIWRDGEFFGDLMVDQVKQFVSKERDQPFFLYWAINFPHYPMQGTAKWREVYRDLPSPRRQYCEFVSTMDEMIGEVLGQLRSLGIDDETLILFQSDHGHSTEERAFFGGGNAGPYRGAKGCLFEGGLRVPSIVSWPGTLPEGEVRDQMVMGCDWFPTISELCETASPQEKLDGKSITAVIKSAEAGSPHDPLYWQLGKGSRAQWVVRQGDWKLLGNPTDRSQKGKLDPKNDQRYLANLKTDLSEAKNLASENGEKVQELQAIRDRYENELPR